MKKFYFISSLIILVLSNAFSQVNLQTIAESSNYTSTSTYKDVISFIGHLEKSSPYIRVENLATSIEGREIPLLVIGNPLPGSPEDLVNDQRIVIYIQANIHAGEVEGKEAALMYTRDLLYVTDHGFLDNVVLLICPILNSDGNEKINTLNRTNQNGPVNGVGVRYNGQFLDLNRDAMKAESPEVKGVLTNVFNRWDPSVFMDCHTTNGSFHVEPVTFTWMVNPNGDNSLISYMRDKMMPEMSENLAGRYNIENCFYGEFYDRMNIEQGWVYSVSEPRYMSNYYGIRNRLGILNENYVYADFKSRVIGCYFLIHSLVEYASDHKAEIINLLENVDKKTIRRGMNPSVSDSFAIECKVSAAKDLVTIKAFDTEVVTSGDGRRSFKKSEKQRTVTIPYFVDYSASKSVKFPYAYIVNVKEPEIIKLLKTHGIELEKLTVDSEIEVECFEIGELTGSGRLNQGHYTNTVGGQYIKESINFPTGTIVVRTAQPLANVAAYLLEPQSNDGMLTWNFFDRYLVPQWGSGYYPYPVYKVIGHTDLKTDPY